MTTSPAGFVAHHARRRAREDQNVASGFTAGPPPEPPPALPTVTRQSPEGVREVVTYTASGAKLVTLVGVEPRSDVVAVAYDRSRRAREALRMQDANLRANRRCRHLL